MRYRKEAITTVATIGVALAIGMMMQQSQTAQAFYGNGDYPQTLPNADDAVLDVREITLTSGELKMPEPERQVDLPPTPVALVQDVQMPQVGGGVETRAAFDDKATDPGTSLDELPACDITAKARPMAAAMVNLTLDASCLPNERVTVLHDGLLFNEKTDDAGQIDVILPALSHDAMFVVAFSNGEGAVARANVEEFPKYDRFVVQWKGETGFELHAREFGADYGDAGHVWSKATRDMSYAVTGQGGFISQLGSPDVVDGLMAEVYTFPTKTAQGSAEVDLSIETMIGEDNCGMEIEAETLQTKRGADITSQNVTLSVPECDAAGTFLVLNNIFEELKVASN